MDFILWQSIHVFFFFCCGGRKHTLIYVLHQSRPVLVFVLAVPIRGCINGGRDIKDRHGDQCRVTPPCLVMGPRY
jgi:hypothetical protein